RDPRHASSHQAGHRSVVKAQGLRGRRAPARRATAAGVRHLAGRAVGAGRNTHVSDVAIEIDNDEELTEFTSESAPVRGKGSSTIAPGAGLGRRKEAVARVRLVPGTGNWVING